MAGTHHLEIDMNTRILKSILRSAEYHLGRRDEQSTRIALAAIAQAQGLIYAWGESNKSDLAILLREMREDLVAPTPDTVRALETVKLAQGELSGWAIEVAS